MSEENQNSTIAAQCASCGSARNRGDRCEYCGALYPDMINSRPPKQKLRSLGKKYSVERGAGRVEITWGWRSASVWLGIPFFLFWNSIAFSFASISDILSDPLSVFPIPAIHMVVGIVGSVYVAACLINKSTIVADRRRLSLRHHPIPWPGNKTFHNGVVRHS